MRTIADRRRNAREAMPLIPILKRWNFFNRCAILDAPLWAVFEICPSIFHGDLFKLCCEQEANARERKCHKRCWSISSHQKSSSFYCLGAERMDSAALFAISESNLLLNLECTRQHNHDLHENASTDKVPELQCALANSNNNLTML